MNAESKIKLLYEIAHRNPDMRLYRAVQRIEVHEKADQLRRPRSETAVRRMMRGIAKLMARVG